VSEGVGAFPLNALGALRQSSSIAYLHPISDLPDTLEVWTETRVSRVIVENGRTVACETSRGRVDVHAEVILAAGAIQTPQLMMVSGLGPADQLKGHGIDVVADLPGVGGNLNDHVAAAVVFDLHEAPPPWQLTAFEAVMLKTVDADAPAPDWLYHFGLTVREKYGLHPRLGNPRHGVKLSPNVTRARSRGSVTLAGGDIEDAPKIDLNYFSDPQGYDMRILLAGTKFARRLIEAPSFAEIVRAETAPGPEVQTDGELEAYIRSVCETVYHPCGTCRMGTDDQAVVTPDLKVRGVDGLSVVDASVFPSIVTVNINFAVMMVAEKAADTILARA